MRARAIEILTLLSASILLVPLGDSSSAREYQLIQDGSDSSPARRIQGARKSEPGGNGLQLARIIGVGPEVRRLAELSAAENGNPSGALTLEELGVQQTIANAVLAASLDVDCVLAEMDYERQQLEELRNILRARRDRATGTTNLAVLVAGTGLGIVGGALAFNKSTSDVGNAVGFASGGISTLFSLRSYRQVHAGTRPSWLLPNMLAAFLDQPQEQHSQYPRDIWAYLNSVPMNGESRVSRRQKLVAEWIADGRIDGQPSSGSLAAQTPDDRNGERRIALLTSSNAADKKLNLGVLNEREAMLADVRDAVAQMKGDLANLVRSLKPQ